MELTDDRALEHVADYFRALSEPQRLKILQVLRNGPRNVGELTTELACSQANVSKHLAVLAKVGLVEREACGTSVYYRFADRRTYDLCDLVCGQVADRLLDQVRGLSLIPATASPQASPRKPTARKPTR
jgi:DNA-binding transcriptional ArsR family regulator